MTQKVSEVSGVCLLNLIWMTNILQLSLKRFLYENLHENLFASGLPQHMYLFGWSKKYIS